MVLSIRECSVINSFKLNQLSRFSVPDNISKSSCGHAFFFDRTMY